MQISHLAKRLKMRPQRLALRAKQLGFASTSPDHELTEMEEFLLVQTRNEPVAKLQEAASKLRTGEAFPLTVRPEAQGASSTVHLVHEQAPRTSQQIPALDQPTQIQFSQLQSQISELRRELRNLVKRNEATDLAEKLATLTQRQGRYEQRLAAIEKSIDILLEMQSVSDQKTSNLARSELGIREELDKVRKLLSDISTRSQSQRIALGENTAAIRGLKETFGRIADSLDGFDQELTSLAGRTDANSLRLDSLFMDVSRIEGRFDPVREEQEKARRVAQRIIEASRKSLNMAALDLSRDVAVAQEKLRAKSLFFTDRLISDCLVALDSGRPILLTGPPGTGKTDLARALPSLYFDGDEGEISTYIEVNNSWGAFEMLGGTWPVGDIIMPKLGAFSRAVVECIERGGRHWLLVDELNRADPDRIFSGLLSTLANLGQAAYILLAEGETPLRVPSSFRLICIANEINLGHLFPLSQELRERFLEIRVAPPPSELESEILKRKINFRAIDSSIRDEFGLQLGRLLILLERIRNFGKEYLLPQLEIGVRTSIQIASRVVGCKARSGPELSQIFDDVIRDEIKVPLSFLSGNVLEELANRVIEARQFPQLHAEVLGLFRHKTSSDFS